MTSSVVPQSWGAQLRDVGGSIAFVTRQSFKSDTLSAGGVALLTAVTAFLPAAQVIATVALIDRLRLGEGLDAMVWPLTLVVLVVALSGPLLAARTALAERSMLSTEVDLQARLAGIVANLPPSRLANAKVAAQVEGHSRAIIDVVSPVYGDAMAALGSIVSAAMVIVTLATMSPTTAVLVLAASAPAIITGRYVSHAIERMWQVLGGIYQRDRYLRDTMSRQRSITELASLGTTHRLARMVSAQQAHIAQIRDIPIAARLRAQVGVGVAGLILLGGAVIAVIVDMNYGPAAVAGVYGVIAAMTATAQGSQSVARLLHFQPQTTAVRRFFRDAPPVFIQAIAPGAENLAVSDLTHRYNGSDHAAITGINLTAKRGEMIALVGVNGAGKTTTVNAVLGLVEAGGGTVAVDGHDRTQLGEAAWLGQFGLLTQEFGRYEFTVRETVALGTPDDSLTDEEIWAALDAARAGEFVRAMPNGLDTQLGEQWGGVGISGGQWQRLALARIYLRNAPIWILDEPTSAIDAEAEQEAPAGHQVERHGRHRSHRGRARGDLHDRRADLQPFRLGREPGEDRDAVGAPRLGRPCRVEAEPLGFLRERDELGGIRPRRGVPHVEAEAHRCDASPAMGEALRPVDTVEPRPTDPETARYVRSYLIMRVVVGALGVALPFLLVFVDGLWFDGDPFPRTSLSAYYYSGVRELFVGALSAIGVFLITYKVAERSLDNTLSLLAGASVVVVALFPTGRPRGVAELTPLQDRLGESVVETIHFVAAAVFISSLAVISYFFGKREGMRPPQEDKRRSRRFWRLYHWACAGAIVLALLWIAVTELSGWGPRNSLLYGEGLAVVAFGASWLLKGLELDMLRGRPAPLAGEATRPS
jgi:ATP-binding cassette, subfamily B, bacterial